MWSVWIEQPIAVPCVVFFSVSISSNPVTSEGAKVWSFENGTYLVDWVRYQMFLPLILLQFLNLFWYSLMVKILVRYVLFMFIGIV